MIDYTELIAAGATELDGLDAKSSAIVEAARRRFADAGIEETTMVQIADEAGVGVATVYRRFSTKNALVRYALVSETVSLTTLILDAVKNTAGPVSGLAEMVAAFVSAASEPLLLTRNLRHPTSPEDMSILLTDDMFLTQGRVMVSRYITYWQKRGELGSFDPDVVAELIVRLEMSIISNPRGVLPLGDRDAARGFAYRYLAPLLSPHPAPAAPPHPAPPHP